MNSVRESLLQDTSLAAIIGTNGSFHLRLPRTVCNERTRGTATRPSHPTQRDRRWNRRRGPRRSAVVSRAGMVRPEGIARRPHVAIRQQRIAFLGGSF